MKYIKKIWSLIDTIITAVVITGLAGSAIIGYERLYKYGWAFIPMLIILATILLLKNESPEIKQIKIKYLDKRITPLEYIGGSDKSNWIDLRAAETVELKAGESKLIPLGVAMQIPDGYEAYIAPRSSTYKNFGIVQTNSIGVVDSSYCGANDQWYMPVRADRDTKIPVNARICQFRIVQNQPAIKFIEDSLEDNKNRGGLGSTGI